MNHVPAAFHDNCLKCRILLFLFRTHGHYPQEVSVETLRAVLDGKSMV